MREVNYRQYAQQLIGYRFRLLRVAVAPLIAAIWALLETECELRTLSIVIPSSGKEIMFSPSFYLFVC